MEDEALRLALRALCITRKILQFPPMKRLLRLLDVMIDDSPPTKRIRAFGAYASALLPYCLDPGKAFYSFLTSDPNPYVESLLQGKEPSEEMKRMLQSELAIVQNAAQVTPDAMRTYLHDEEYLPIWHPTKMDIAASYHAYLQSARTDGFGMYRDHHMFVVRGTRITPVGTPDPIAWDLLEGYAYQRRLVKQNTNLLLQGESASNILLYGDSGTGKSSTVKAIANLLWPKGLRLIEVRKSQLHQIPELLEELAENSLKFILFIDDLSFVEEDDDFVALKGILEGSILSQAPNVVVYATSNRRRLIKETFSARGSDDVHANETVQQMAALSDRFGLTIPFMDPKKDDYLKIVAAIASERGIHKPENELFQGAERFALEKGGRSGRAARQYIDQLSLSAEEE